MKNSRFTATYTFVIAALVGGVGCSHESPRPAPATPKVVATAPPPPKSPEPPRHVVPEGPYRGKAGRYELYLPQWFAPTRKGYDLLVHFHGLPKLQEANLDRSKLNVAVVTINLGVGTDPYALAFRNPDAFEKLLADTQDEVERSGRGEGAHLHRVALSAWSAGFLSISKIMNHPESAARIDAVLLADGFFSTFTEPRRRVLDVGPLERFVKLADAASRNDKLFAITHTAIPTGDYPSVTETVAKLLEMGGYERLPSSAAGPKNLRETYAVDRGSFHVRGYEGLLAGDHVKQIQVMGETLYPLLKTRWAEQDAR